jgi:hypothetical protein
MPQPTWVAARAEQLCAELDAHGMSMSLAGAEKMIHERVRYVAAHSGVSQATARGYLTDDAVAGLAFAMLNSFPDEEPGTDLFAAKRSVTLRLELAGRCVAALAEAVHLHLEETDLDTVRTTSRHLIELLSLIGQLIDDAGRSSTPAVVLVPPAALVRAARYLDAAAHLVTTAGRVPPGFDPRHADQLAASFRRDALRLRTASSE